MEGEKVKAGNDIDSVCFFGLAPRGVTKVDASSASCRRDIILIVYFLATHQAHYHTASILIEQFDTPRVRLHTE